MRRLMQMLVVVVVLLGTLVPASSARAEDEGHPAIVWVGTVATNIFYIPTKTVHAAMGGLIGGMAWLVTGLNPEVSQAVFDHTIFTDWYVSPENLEGKQDLHFFSPADSTE